MAYMQFTPRNSITRLTVIGTLALGATGHALAQGQADDATATRAYVQIGHATGVTRSATVGVTWPWPWPGSRHWEIGGGSVTGHWDAYVSHWRAPSASTAGAFEGLTQVGLVPVLRWRADQGRAPWFVEGGIGVSLLDVRYQTPRKQFGTRFNFADHLGVGINFGAGRRHEVALNLQHISNADIRKPNPGENFVQLRYGLAF